MNTSFIGSADDAFDDGVSIAVVTAVAARRGVEPTELPPLYEWVDPDALDALFEPTTTGGPRRGRLSFTYDGHEVVLECDDGVAITIDGTPVSGPISATGPSRSGEFQTDA